MGFQNMKLKVKLVGFSTGGKPIAVLNKDDAGELGVRSSDRISIKYGKAELIAITNITSTLVKKGEIGICEELNHVKLRENTEVEVEVANYPSSMQFIRNKLKGRKLSFEEILSIVKDVTGGYLSEIEISAFVTSLQNYSLDLDEATSLTLSMVETGKRLQLDKKIIVDKHSIGGCAGDKTTLILVPIIAAAGLTIPKTSSRAITSAGGTADRAECLMPVEIEIDEMKRIVEKTGGCIVWGGSLHLAPADDIFIQVEYPLSIDPLLMPSIMSKKLGVGATHLVIDIPVGRGTKVKTIGDGNLLAKDFIELGKKVGIITQCAITYGEQPVGYTIGPAIEAREALEILMRRKVVPDAIEKAVSMAGMMLEMSGKENGRELALEILKSGKAEKKLREIIFEQGGSADIKPEDIQIGNYGTDVVSTDNGVILWMDNHSLIEIARAAGAPKDKGAGIQLYKKLGDPVKKGEKLFTVYSEKSRKLNRVRKILEEETSIGAGSRIDMLIHKVKEVPIAKRAFILER
jgi:AMP phosphorylase